MTPPKRAAAKSSKRTSAKRSAKSPKRTTTAKRKPAAAPKEPAKKKVRGAHLVSVFGPFNSRVLIEMSATLAGELFDALGQPTSHSRVIDAVEHEIAEIRKRAPKLADDQLAATAVALAYELEHPGNSATSKSMCARTLNETMDRLREMAPAKPEADGIDELTRKRDTRRERVAARSPKSASSVRS